MKRFYCTCGQEIYFANTYCYACGASVGFCPDTKTLITSKDDQWISADNKHYKACAHRDHDLSCNWLIPAEDTHQTQCLSCSLTRRIPVLNIGNNRKRWQILERQKRRLLYSLLEFNLPIEGRMQRPQNGLVFDFLEDKRTNPSVSRDIVYTGHNNGCITINVAEADDVHRIMERVKMNERYRTVLGHMRHEMGHYYWDKLIRNTHWYSRFRHVFGNESNYRSALNTYYHNGSRPGWQQRYISAYASSHPWEDWAESWAHYMHMRDTLETASSYASLTDTQNTSEHEDFETLMNNWQQVSVMMNALNRSMGMPDAYPFSLSQQVIVKLRFVHRVITEKMA